MDALENANITSITQHLSSFLSELQALEVGALQLFNNLHGFSIFQMRNI